MPQLDEKVAIITGAGGGIGSAGALLFAQEGARVVVVDINAETVASTVAKIESHGGTALGVETDVTKLDEVQTMVDRTMSTYGRIDILWNNAGIIRATTSPIEDISVETWHEVLSVNLDGVFYGLKCVIPHMKAQRSGAIVNTASIAGLIANYPGRAPYTASKGAIISLTRMLALELAGFNIRVNCIAPAHVRTDLTMMTPSTVDVFGIDWEPTPPLPLTDATRDIEPEELAYTALFLVSDKVGPLTGATIVHDGGRTSR